MAWNFAPYISQAVGQILENQQQNRKLAEEQRQNTLLEAYRNKSLMLAYDKAEDLRVYHEQQMALQEQIKSQQLEINRANQESIAQKRAADIEAKTKELEYKGKEVENKTAQLKMQGELTGERIKNYESLISKRNQPGGSDYLKGGKWVVSDDKERKQYITRSGDIAADVYSPSEETYSELDKLYQKGTSGKQGKEENTATWDALKEKTDTIAEDMGLTDIINVAWKAKDKMSLSAILKKADDYKKSQGEPGLNSDQKKFFIKYFKLRTTDAKSEE